MRTKLDLTEFVRGLARPEGLENPTEKGLPRMGRKRTDNKVSNEHWESLTDPGSRVTKIKDGRAHLAYKAEHAVDLKIEPLVAVHITERIGAMRKAAGD